LVRFEWRAVLGGLDAKTSPRLTHGGALIGDGDDGVGKQSRLTDHRLTLNHAGQWARGYVAFLPGAVRAANGDSRGREELKDGARKS